MAKTVSKSFSPSNSSQKSPFFAVLILLFTATPDISSSSENIGSAARVSRLSFRFLWLWYKKAVTVTLQLKKLLLIKIRLLKIFIFSLRDFVSIQLLTDKKLSLRIYKSRFLPLISYVTEYSLKNCLIKIRLLIKFLWYDQISLLYIYVTWSFIFIKYFTFMFYALLCIYYIFLFFFLLYISIFILFHLKLIGDNAFIFIKKYLHYNDLNFLLYKDFYLMNFTSYSAGKIWLSICMQDRAKPALGHDKMILCLAHIR